MSNINDLAIKLFADGANVDDIRGLAAQPYIRGFTTNPTLMRQAGVANYAAFARDVLAIVPDRPVSFEVFADDFNEMTAQAREIASWGRNVNVKIPVTNTKGDFTGPVISTLSSDGVVVNVTAVFTADQVTAVAAALAPQTPAIVSVFAGRIADTGRDPIPAMVEAKRRLADRPQAELLWASPRELLNIFHADQAGCDIITVTTGLLDKLTLVDHDLGAFSLETVRMFHGDSLKAGYSIALADVSA